MSLTKEISGTEVLQRGSSLLKKNASTKESGHEIEANAKCFG